MRPRNNPTRTADSAVVFLTLDGIYDFRFCGLPLPAGSTPIAVLTPHASAWIFRKPGCETAVAEVATAASRMAIDYNGETFAPLDL